MTRSAGRSPAPHMTRAWASPMRAQSSRPMAKTVGRPVVPLVPWIRATSPASTQRCSPNGGRAAWVSRTSAFCTTGKRARSASVRSVAGDTPAASQRRR
jgi:hypothetical protein